MLWQRRVTDFIFMCHDTVALKVAEQWVATAEAICSKLYENLSLLKVKQFDTARHGLALDVKTV